MAGGRAVCSGALAIGAHELVAAYSGDATHAGSETGLAIDIVRAAETIEVQFDVTIGTPLRDSTVSVRGSNLGRGTKVTVTVLSTPIEVGQFVVGPDGTFVGQFRAADIA